MAVFRLDTAEFDRLQRAIKNFPVNAEEVITETLHEEAGPILKEEILRLMPRSDVKPWKGKLPHAKDSKSLTDTKGNLSITVRSAKKYQYLYFPDSGENTVRHRGNQQFFMRGGENKQKEIIDRCISRLVGEVEKI